MCNRTLTRVLLLVLFLTRLTSELHPEEDPEEKHLATKIKKRESSAESDTKSNDDSTRNLDDWMTKKGFVRYDLMAVQAVVVKDEQAAGCEIANQKSQTRYLMCAGSILSDHYILTSASCIYEATYIRHNIKAPLAVAVGLLSKKMQVIRVVATKVHPFHQTDPNSPEHTKHDIAILKLACRIEEENLHKIELPKAPLADLCSYHNCRVALIQKIGQTSIQIQEVLAANIPLSRRRRATQDKVFELNDNNSKTMPIDHEQQPGRTLKLAEPPIFTSKVTNPKTNDESTSEMVNYQSNTSKTNPKNTYKSNRDNTSITSILEEQELLKGTIVPVAKDNEVQANITRPKDIQNQREEENVQGNVEVEESSRKGKTETSKTNDIRRSTNVAERESTTKKSVRSFVTRSSDGTRGCPQTGSPTMFEKTQAGLVAISCDDRQPTEKWRYTDLFENVDWIEGMLKNWNYDATKRSEKNSEKQDERLCSTCIFNFFINYYNDNNKYREPASSNLPSTMIVDTTSFPSVETASSTMSSCLPEQDNTNSTTTISEQTVGSRSKVTKFLVKATVITQDVPIGGNKPNSSLLASRRKINRPKTRSSWHSNRNDSHQPMIPATLIQKKRPAFGQRRSTGNNNQPNQPNGKYFGEPKYILRPSREQTMSEWRPRIADYSVRNSRKTKKQQNEDSRKVDDGTIFRKRTSEIKEEPDVKDEESDKRKVDEGQQQEGYDLQGENRNEFKGLLKSLIAKWSELPIILSNETGWSELTGEQADGTNDNWRTIKLIPAQSKNVAMEWNSVHNAADRDSIYRKFGAIPLDSGNLDGRRKVIGKSFDDEEPRDPRVNVEELSPEEMVSLNKYGWSSRREDVEDRGKQEVPAEGSLTLNGDQIEPRPTGTSVTGVAEESLQDVGEWQKLSVSRVEGLERTEVECSNDYVDSIRTFSRNGADIRQVGQ